LEQQVFTLEQPISIFSLFNPETKEIHQAELSRMVKRLLCFLVSIEENPYVRYNYPESNINLSERFAKMLQNEMDNYGKLDSDFEALKNKKRATLVILDRGVDMISPLIHEFTYQAMMNDILATEGGKYVYL
jgi:syntaxin-binding protein 1